MVSDSDKIKGEIKLAHGAGGRLSHQLARIFAGVFDNPLLAPLADSAVFDLGGTRVAFTTDSHVVSPLFFPGGDVGRLAVFGTCNDLAVMGAKPLYLSCGMIIEEGFAAQELERVVASLAQAAQEAGVIIVTGDTKVVQRGKGDGIFINTAGLGVIEPGADLCGDDPEPGDRVILSGTLGDHAAAILTAREGLRFAGDLVSDCAPLAGMLGDLLRGCRGVKWMRDPTRGGLAAALNELAENRPFGIILEEEALPLKPQVRGLCELLGFDPLHLANEGKAVIIVRHQDAEAALKILQSHSLGRDAAIIGRLEDRPVGRVVLNTAIGGKRILDMPAGELLPRIC
jgi:hydrogenase expression/formation protein HypE